MDINKLHSLNNSNLDKTNNTSGSTSSQGSSKSGDHSSEDKISISDYTFRNNDKLFAKLELEKLNNTSQEHFDKIKSQVSDYKKAAQQSSEEAEQTELGQKLNDSSVWDDIAQKILK